MVEPRLYHLMPDALPPKGLTVEAKVELAQHEHGIPMRLPVDVISAGQCGRQADLCIAEAHREADIMIQTALRNMADQWRTLERQIEWIAETRARPVKMVDRLPGK